MRHTGRNGSAHADAGTLASVDGAGVPAYRMGIPMRWMRKQM